MALIMRSTSSHSRRGQALLELAIFGALALAALGLLIRLGMRMNFDQEIRMAAFRRALAAAHADNGTDRDAVATIYHEISDRRMPNPTDGHMGMPRNRTSASAFVEWGDRLSFAYNTGVAGSPLGRETQPKVYIRSNNVEEPHYQDEFPEDFITVSDGATVTTWAFRGIESKSRTTNTSQATITQTETNSSLSSSTSTCSDTTLNTLTSDHIGSCVDGQPRAVNW